MTTNASGDYTVDVPPGTYLVRFTAAGFNDQWYDLVTTPQDAMPVTVAANTPGYAAGFLSPTPSGTTLTAPTPTISGPAGAPRFGDTLTAVPGTWGPAPVALTYQWFRSGVLINGATKTTYLLGGADVGKTMTVAVTGTKIGFTSATRTSAATVAVEPATLTTAAPTVTGTAKVGSRLTAKPGTWGPQPVALAYQWYRGSTKIARATGSSYLLTSADVKAKVTVRVTGTKLFYATVTRTSAAKTIAAGTLTASVPKITGTVKAGRTVSVNRGAWGPAPVTFTYQWYVGTTKIAGARGASYKVPARLVGKKIAVVVTGSKAGYTTVSKRSALTGKVKS